MTCVEPYVASADQGKPNTCSGNPINTATGNKLQLETDLNTALGQWLSRSYNSSSPVDQGLGRGWRIAFLRRIVFAASSTYDAPPLNQIDPDWIEPVVTNPTYYLVERADGKSFAFDLNGQPLFVQSSNLFQLTVNKDGAGKVTGFTVFDGYDQEQYNANGALTKLISPNGWTITLSYRTSTTLPDKISDNLGHVLKLTSPDRFHLGSITVGSNSTPAISYAYDSKGRLSTVTYADSSTRSYLYEDSNNPYLLTGITDENGVRYASWTYNTQGQAISSEHAGGVERFGLSFGGDSINGPRWTDETDPLGSVRRYNFKKVAGAWLLDGKNQPGGAGCAAAANGLSYDANGNVTSRTDFNGNTTTYVYDLARNLETSRTEAAGTAQVRIIATTWHATWRLPATVTEPNRMTTFDYDTSANLIKKTITSGDVSRVWRWTYGNFGLVATATDPNGKVTTYTYDAAGNLATLKNPANQTIQFTSYDANGNLLSMTDANKVVTTLTYDLRNRLKTRQTGSELTRFSYDLVGQLKQVSFADGSSLSYDYDPAHRLTDIRDNRNGRVHYELDAMGNTLREDRYDPDGTLAAGLQQAATQHNLPNTPAQAQ